MKISNSKHNSIGIKELTSWGDITSNLKKKPIEYEKKNPQRFVKFSPVHDDIIKMRLLIEKYTKISKIVFGLLILISVTLIVTTVVGLTLHKTTGYKCSNCATNYYLLNTGSIYCVSKKLKNESCSSSNECRGDLGLVCNQGTCQCSSSQTWSNTNQTCKMSENSTCSISSDCCEPMSCISNICHCGAFQYHDTSTLLCTPQKTYMQSCSVNYHCRADKYLQCLNGKCDCTPVYPTYAIGTWNSIRATCLNCPNGWLLHGVSCYKSVDCPTAFLNLTTSLIQSSCGSYTNVRLASGLTNADVTWLNDVPSTQNASYIGPVDPLFCLIFDGISISYHPCTHGIEPKHGIICQFDV
jgi:hypothetical protein